MAVPPDFVPWMQDQVAQWADRYGCNARRAFPAWALNFVLEVEEDDAFNQTETLSQGDAGLDGWYYDRVGGVFHLIQAKYLDDPVNGTVAPGDVDPLLRAAHLLRNSQSIEDGPHHDRLTTAALQMREAMLDDASISLDLFIAGRMSEQGAAEFQAAALEMEGNCSGALYDTERLYELKLADDPIEDLADQTLMFALAGNDEFYERGHVELAGVERAAVAVLDGRSIADAVDQWRARLFHGNVRYYLRRSNRVNKSMLATLDDEAGRRAFWLYNNGLTIVADDFKFETRGDKRVLVAKNPQIVNGAQTSSVLRERRAHLLAGDVSVQARIIAVADDADGRAALEKISEFTNSQSPVRAGDLRSNDRRQRELQRAFGMLPSPVFYERRRGEWTSLDAATKGTFGGRVVTKEDVGQRFVAFRGRPAKAVSKKDAIFDELEADAFDPNISAHVYMLAYSLYQQADHLMKVSNAQQLLALVPALDQAVVPGDRAPTQVEVLRRAHKLVCAHATALAHEVLRWRYNDIGPQRAQALRERIVDGGGTTYRFVWRYTFRAIRAWLMMQPDKSAVKAVLQRADTMPAMKGALDDILVEADRDELEPI
ncbi:MAG TPA: AIPR family protein [Frankiaceae bacterium]|nr:AIPR family protein [Frankiaceae bacterium]